MTSTPTAVWIDNDTRHPSDRLAGLVAQAIARQAGVHEVPRLAPGPRRREIVEGILRERREPFVVLFAERGDRDRARAAVSAETIVRFTERAPEVVEARVERAGLTVGPLRLRVGAEIDGDLSRAGEPLQRALGRLARAVLRRRVGVALSGGGAWGFAHCALLRGLEARGIPVDVVAGVSFGSLVGALYAGRGLAGLDALVESAPRIGAAVRRNLVSTSPIERFVDEHLRGRALEDLEVAFLPVAVDVVAAREVVLTRGSVAAGVRASCAFPGLWAPVVRDGARYVDGFITSSVPVSCLAGAGADVVIASNVMMPPSPRPPVPSTGSRWSRWWAGISPSARLRDLRRAIRLLGAGVSRLQAAAADLAFQPDLSAFRITDFAAAPRIVTHAAAQLGPVLDAAEVACAPDPRGAAEADRLLAARG
jgi:predicted acylesterase/phospholipase RssA